MRRGCAVAVRRAEKGKAFPCARHRDIHQARFFLALAAILRCVHRIVLRQYARAAVAQDHFIIFQPLCRVDGGKKHAPVPGVLAA